MRHIFALVLGLMPVTATATDCINLANLTETGRIDTAKCRDYRAETGTRGSACQWTYDYRDASAIDHARALQTTITACHPGLTAPEDTLVNHPDSYELWEWETETGTFAVSVKDKAALQKTLVFLRFERAP